MDDKRIPEFVYECTPTGRIKQTTPKRRNKPGIVYTLLPLITKIRDWPLLKYYLIYTFAAYESIYRTKGVQDFLCIIIKTQTEERQHLCVCVCVCVCVHQHKAHIRIKQLFTLHRLTIIR